MKKQSNLIATLFGVLFFVVRVEGCQPLENGNRINPSSARKEATSSKDTNQLGNPGALGTPIRAYKVRELEFIHSVATIERSHSYYAISRLTDDQLKAACTNPTPQNDPDWVTVKRSTKRLLNGNTRVHEPKKRGFLDFYVPCDEGEEGDPAGYGMYDI